MFLQLLEFFIGLTLGGLKRIKVAFPEPWVGLSQDLNEVTAVVVLILLDQQIDNFGGESVDEDVQGDLLFQAVTEVGVELKLILRQNEI